VKYDSPGRKLFLAGNYIFLTLLALAMLLPFLNVIAQSFSSPGAIDRGEVMFWPVEFTLAYYEHVFQDVSIWRAFGISVYITLLGTFINLAATASLAYPLSRPEYVGRKTIMVFILMTMIFTAPLIPQFILMRELSLVNTLWSLMLPTAISAFNLFVLRTFFAQIPNELIDSSRIDGCSEARTLWSIVLPLSKPAIATVGIFYSVTNWNKYMDALYYINDRAKYPLQVKLRELLVNRSKSRKGTCQAPRSNSRYYSPKLPQSPPIAPPAFLIPPQTWTGRESSPCTAYTAS